MNIKPRTRVAAAAATAVLAIPAVALAATKSLFGSTDRGTTAQISDDGNVLGFGGPVIGSDYEHMNVGALSEGYVLCYRNPRTGAMVTAYDVGTAAAGFGPSSANDSDANNRQVIRSTSDGLLQLKQGFSFYGKEKRLLVGMDVINPNPYPITDVVLRRQADFDVDSGGADAWAGSRNLWARTSRDSIFAWTEPATAANAGKEAHGMLMTHRAGHIHQSGVYTELPASTRSAKVTESPLDSSCNPPAKPTPVTVPADDGGTLQVNIGTIAAAPSPGSDTRANVTVWYQRL